MYLSSKDIPFPPFGLISPFSLVGGYERVPSFIVFLAVEASYTALMDQMALRKS